MSRRVPVGVVGATGLVGQRLVRRLARHRWFRVVAVAGGPRSVGCGYGEAVRWRAPGGVPSAVARARLREPAALAGLPIVFSALGRREAAVVEPALAAAGSLVVSNASALRAEPSVPLVVPEVNPDHLGLLVPGSGGVVTNPNCVVAGLVPVLAALHRELGVRSVAVTTLQAASGAGLDGVGAAELLGDAIGEIPGEEEKIAAEPRKILGRLEDGRIVPAPLPISVQAVRVPVVEGHLLSVSVAVHERADPARVAALLRAYRAPEGVLGLPTVRRHPIRVVRGAPRPRLHAGEGDGMVVTVGRVRRCPVLGFRLLALVHNLERGAAGAAVANAELALRHGLVPGYGAPG